MAFNRIAIYGHRGWASSAIVAALVASGAPVRVLHRPDSDVSVLPNHVDKVAVDINNQEGLVAALKEVDILISLVGHDGIESQHELLKAIPHTSVRLFSPSDLAARYDEEGLSLPVNASKAGVEAAARDAGIPVTIVLPGNFAEFALATPALGVNSRDNEITFSGNSATEPLNICTRNYVAAAYASIFTKTPIREIENRTIGLCELRPTGNDIASALAQAHGRDPTKTADSLFKVSAGVTRCLAEGSPFALMWYCRKVWATGQQSKMVGSDIWEVPGYTKATLQTLLAEGKLEPYREMPPQIIGAMIQELAK
ncbi:hypothetical protein LTR17_018906 [Elasticomyces elasticus]|nr:hypothetical protein LTR17_018906 [Elasticomyces elasticus]